MTTDDLIKDYMQPISYTPKRVRAKEAPREVKYIKRMGMDSRHRTRANDVLQLRAIPRLSMRKHLRDAMMGRIGVNKPWGLATTYFLTKNKKV